MNNTICENELKRVNSNFRNANQNELQDGDKINFLDLFNLCFTDSILCNNLVDRYGEELFDSMLELNDFSDDENVSSADDDEYIPEIYQYFIVEKDNYYFDKFGDNFIMMHIDDLDLDIVGIPFWGLSWTLISTSAIYEK